MQLANPLNTASRTQLQRHVAEIAFGASGAGCGCAAVGKGAEGAGHHSPIARTEAAWRAGDGTNLRPSARVEAWIAWKGCRGGCWTVIHSGAQDMASGGGAVEACLAGGAGCTGASQRVGACWARKGLDGQGWAEIARRALHMLGSGIAVVARLAGNAGRPCAPSGIGARRTGDNLSCTRTVERGWTGDGARNKCARHRSGPCITGYGPSVLKGAIESRLAWGTSALGAANGVKATCTCAVCHGRSAHHRGKIGSARYALPGRHRARAWLGIEARVACAVVGDGVH